jgi:hypothetical protein
MGVREDGITHIDEGLVFLGQRFIRRPKGPKRYVYTLVCDDALASVMRTRGARRGTPGASLRHHQAVTAFWYSAEATTPTMASWWLRPPFSPFVQNVHPSASGSRRR